jgi:hypothetical protein
VRRGLFRGARPGARRFAVVCASAGALIGFALFLAAAIGGTSEVDRYGRLPLPGKRAFDLPAGDIAVYYEEHVTLHDDETLDAPDGIVVKAKRERRTVKSRRTTPNAINTGGKSYEEFGRLRIPAAGRYVVKARSRQPGSNRPEVTLGKGQTEALKRGGIRAGIALAAGALLALVALLVARRGDEPPPSAPSQPTSPPRRPTSIRL